MGDKSSRRGAVPTACLDFVSDLESGCVFFWPDTWDGEQVSGLSVLAVKTTAMAW